jgi:hypothetical protein
VEDDLSRRPPYKLGIDLEKFGNREDGVHGRRPYMLGINFEKFGNREVGGTRPQ